ncbi:MAG: TauD/TfdA family dioxygenase [Burkholderiaceae bacterium]
MNAPLRANAVEALASPFDLDDDVSYWRWRAWKLAAHPQRSEDLVVDVADPRALTAAERGALRERIVRANMAIYRSRVLDADPQIARALGTQLGLRRLDANWLADEDGISRITVSDHCDGRGGFIAYTDRAIGWHTDGYYHPQQRRIQAMILHCVRPARRGGVNALLDHEMAYISLRDASKHHVRALMQADAMTIPARHDLGADEAGAAADAVARAAQAGPVISVEAAQRHLHLRYTARQRSIEWKADAATRAARACLEALLAGAAPWIFRVHLQAGMGIVGHNVLHERTGFEDDPARPRLLYRARYLDRVAVSEPGAWRNG